LSNDGSAGGVHRDTFSTSSAEYHDDVDSSNGVLVSALEASPGRRHGDSHFEVGDEILVERRAAVGTPNAAR
jgi:hypothetical protein